MEFKHREILKFNLINPGIVPLKDPRDPDRTTKEEEEEKLS